MTRLTDTQAIILSAAAARPDGNVLPLPGSLRGGAAGKVVRALLSRGLIRDWTLQSNAPTNSSASGISTSDGIGSPVLLEITPAGFEAIGAEAPSEAASGARPAKEGPMAAEGPAATPAAIESHRPTPRKSREGSKQALLIAMLRRQEGVTIVQAVEALGWQAHYADTRIMPM